MGRGNKRLFVVSGSHYQGHMATTPACIYGKNHSKSSSPVPVDRFPRDLVCSIRDSGPITVCLNDDPRVLALFYDEVKFCRQCVRMGLTFKRPFNGKNL